MVDIGQSILAGFQVGAGIQQQKQAMAVAADNEAYSRGMQAMNMLQSLSERRVEIADRAAQLAAQTEGLSKQVIAAQANLAQINAQRVKHQAAARYLADPASVLAADNALAAQAQATVDGLMAQARYTGEASNLLHDQVGQMDEQASSLAQIAARYGMQAPPPMTGSARPATPQMGAAPAPSPATAEPAKPAATSASLPMEQQPNVTINEPGNKKPLWGGWKGNPDPNLAPAANAPAPAATPSPMATTPAERGKLFATSAGLPVGQPSADGSAYEIDATDADHAKLIQEQVKRYATANLIPDDQIPPIVVVDLNERFAKDSALLGPYQSQAASAAARAARFTQLLADPKDIATIRSAVREQLKDPSTSPEDVSFLEGMLKARDEDVVPLIKQNIADVQKGAQEAEFARKFLLKRIEQTVTKLGGGPVVSEDPDQVKAALRSRMFPGVNVLSEAQRKAVIDAYNAGIR